MQYLTNGLKSIGRGFRNISHRGKRLVALGLIGAAGLGITYGKINTVNENSPTSKNRSAPTIENVVASHTNTPAATPTPEYHPLTIENTPIAVMQNASGTPVLYHEAGEIPLFTNQYPSATEQPEEISEPTTSADKQEAQPCEEEPARLQESSVEIPSQDTPPPPSSPPVTKVSESQQSGGETPCHDCGPARIGGMQYTILDKNDQVIGTGTYLLERTSKDIPCDKADRIADNIGEIVLQPGQRLALEAPKKLKTEDPSQYTLEYVIRKSDKSAESYPQLEYVLEGFSKEEGTNAAQIHYERIKDVDSDINGIIWVKMYKEVNGKKILCESYGVNIQLRAEGAPQEEEKTIPPVAPPAQEQPVPSEQPIPETEAPAPILPPTTEEKETQVIITPIINAPVVIEKTPSTPIVEKPIEKTPSSPAPYVPQRSNRDNEKATVEINFGAGSRDLAFTNVLTNGSTLVQSFNGNELALGIERTTPNSRINASTALREYTAGTSIDWAPPQAKLSESSIQAALILAKKFHRVGPYVEVGGLYRTWNMEDNRVNPYSVEDSDFAYYGGAGLLFGDMRPQHSYLLAGGRWGRQEIHQTQEGFGSWRSFAATEETKQFRLEGRLAFEKFDLFGAYSKGSVETVETNDPLEMIDGEGDIRNQMIGATYWFGTKRNRGLSFELHNDKERTPFVTPEDLGSTQGNRDASGVRVLYRMKY